MRGGGAVALALLLALRVMALPMVMAAGAPGPGMMAICTGAEIIYIPIGGDGPVDPASGPPHDPCPAFGMTAALDVPGLTMPAPRERVHATGPAARHAVLIPEPRGKAHRPRAPPLA